MANTGYRLEVYERYHSNLGSKQASWEAQLQETRRAARRFLAPFLPKRRNARILELACGTGLIVDYLQNEGYTEIEAIDRSPEQVAIAHTHGLTRVRCEDAQSCLADKKRFYDLIIAIDLLEHLTKDETIQLLKAIAEALKPAGQLYIRTPNGAALLGHCMQMADFTHETAFSPRSLTQALESCGLSAVHFSECGPIPDRPASLCRWLLWKVWCSLQRFVWLIDTGDSGPPVLSPNMICCASLTNPACAHFSTTGERRQG